MTDPYLLHFRYESKLSTVPSIASPIRRSTSAIGLLHLLCVRPLLPYPRIAVPNRTEEYDEDKGDCDEYEEDASEQDGEDEQEIPRPTKDE